MECDEIPDSSQDVDPLGNVDNCNRLGDESETNTGLLSTTIIPANNPTERIVRNRKGSFEAAASSSISKENVNLIRFIACLSTIWPIDLFFSFNICRQKWY